jgi:nickel-dependent lactate racemase
MPPDKESFRRLFDDMFYGKQPFWHACLWLPILQTLKKKEIIVVTEEQNLPAFKEVKLPAEIRMEEALGSALKKHGPKAKVGVFPYGKWVLPKGLNG